MAEKTEKHERSDEVHYAARKCDATGRLITPQDHASVQIYVGHVNEAGIYTRECTAFALCGQVRAKGQADDAFNRLAAKAGLLKNVVPPPKSW